MSEINKEPKINETAARHIDLFEIRKLQASLLTAWTTTCSEDASEDSENFINQLHEGWDVIDAYWTIEALLKEIARLKSVGVPGYYTVTANNSFYISKGRGPYYRSKAGRNR